MAPNKHGEAIERAVDVIRQAFGTYGQAMTAKQIIQAIPSDYGKDVSQKVRLAADEKADAAWNTIRPALRRLIEEVTEKEA